MSTRNSSVSEAIGRKRIALAEAMVARKHRQQPEVLKSFGEEGRASRVQDYGNHLAYLKESISKEDPSVFSDYILWLKDLIMASKTRDDSIQTTLDLIHATLRDSLPDEMHDLLDQYMQTARGALEYETTAEPSWFRDDSPLFGLATQFLDALLKGDRHAADNMIMNAVDRGIEIRDIYLQVLQRSQYEIGRLWHRNEITVGQEHYCSMATQLIMSRLYPYIFSSERIGRKLVLACVSGELHEIGARMVADFFELEGWDTYYLGANTPRASILSALKTNGAHVLGVSVTMQFHGTSLRELISYIREHPEADAVKILVGGYALRNSEDSWRELGADGFGADAEQAVRTANDLLETQAPS
jgi:methanogenic corrinoid protein MtbC1